MNCISCNKVIEADSKFCPFCGAKVEDLGNLTLLDVDKEFLDHMEFLGYELEKTNPVSNATRYLAKHPTKPTFFFNSVSEFGISFVSFYILDEKKVKDSYEIALETINRMNNRALFTSFSMTTNLKNLVCGSFYLGKYNKKQFGEFIDLYIDDIQRRLAEENYLKDIS